jgi:hypothetical protein
MGSGLLDGFRIIANYRRLQENDCKYPFNIHYMTKGMWTPARRTSHSKMMGINIYIYMKLVPRRLGMAHSQRTNSSQRCSIQHSFSWYNVGWKGTRDTITAIVYRSKCQTVSLVILLTEWEDHLWSCLWHIYAFPLTPLQCTNYVKGLTVIQLKNPPSPSPPLHLHWRWRRRKEHFHQYYCLQCEIPSSTVRSFNST